MSEKRRLAKHLSSPEKILVVVAGPNGAGKSTVVETFIDTTNLRVVNPDAIARALFPGAPEQVAYEAAAAADRVRHDLLSRGVSFCMETVFSDREGSKIAFLREARANGYTVFLVVIGIESSELAIARVVERVEAGGHDVPDEKIIKRFPRTFQNLREALTFVDHAFLFDNSRADQPYRFVGEYEQGKLIRRGRARPKWLATLRSTPAPRRS